MGLYACVKIHRFLGVLLAWGLTVQVRTAFTFTYSDFVELQYLKTYWVCLQSVLELSSQLGSAELN